ncbi:MAG TPA: hypothetical protein VFP58_06735, partial [Candidatus Eisenbacteria bacterium]|nr:hypothetical protein [Candidatus Eisenbacteria bacterium]
MASTTASPSATLAEAASRVADKLVARHGAREAERIRLGVRQVAERWWPEDGTEEDLASFCEETWLQDD